MGYYKICGLHLIGAVHPTHVSTHVGPIIERGAMPPNKFTLGLFFFFLLSTCIIAFIKEDKRPKQLHHS